MYADGESDTQAKNLISIGEGDTLQFIFDYFTYEGEYQATYKFGDPITLTAETEIANTPVGDGASVVTYLFTDYYQQNYWTPAAPV